MIRSLSALVAVLTMTVAAPAPASAECTRLSPWPSLEAAMPTARDVVVVDVTESLHRTFDGRQAPTPEFRVEVVEVLRGTAPTDLEFDAFKSGAPTPRCPGDSVLWVHLDDRIVIAYGAHPPGLDGPIDAVGFVEPSRPDRGLMPKMETLSLQRVRTLADRVLPPTDAVEPGSTDATSRTLTWWGPLAFIAE